MATIEFYVLGETYRYKVTDEQAEKLQEKGGLLEFITNPNNNISLFVHDRLPVKPLTDAWTVYGKYVVRDSDSSELVMDVTTSDDLELGEDTVTSFSTKTSSSHIGEEIAPQATGGFSKGGELSGGNETYESVGGGEPLAKDKGGNSNSTPSARNDDGETDAGLDSAEFTALGKENDVQVGDVKNNGRGDNTERGKATEANVNRVGEPGGKGVRTTANIGLDKDVPTNKS